MYATSSDKVKSDQTYKFKRNVYIMNFKDLFVPSNLFIYK